MKLNCTPISSFICYSTIIGMMPASLVTSLRLTPPAADNWLLADPGTLQTTLAATHQTTHKTQLGCAEFTFFVKINLSPERGDESASNTNTVSGGTGTVRFTRMGPTQIKMTKWYFVNIYNADSHGWERERDK